MKARNLANNKNAKNPNKYKRWQWYKHLEFLNNVPTRRMLEANNTAEHEDTAMCTVKEESLFLHDSTDENTNNTVLSSLPEIPAPMTKAEELSEGDHQLLYYSDSKNSTDRPYDEVDHLFLSYAHTFKRFSARRRAMLKMDLANLFGQAELQELDENIFS